MLLYGSHRTEKVGVRIMLLTHAYKVVSVQLAMKANLLPLSSLLLLSMRERFNALQQKGSGLLLQHSCSGLGLLS